MRGLNIIKSFERFGQLNFLQKVSCSDLSQTCQKSNASPNKLTPVDQFLSFRAEALLQK